MLADQPLATFIPVRSLVEAQSFYVDVVGLRVKDLGPYAVVLDAGGSTLRLALVDDFQPQPFTIAGWQVQDIASSITHLTTRGVSFNRYEGMDQD